MDPSALQFEVSLQFCLIKQGRCHDTQVVEYSLPATLLPRRLISPLAGSQITVVKQPLGNWAVRTFPYDVFQLFL